MTKERPADSSPEDSSPSDEASRAGAADRKKGAADRKKGARPPYEKARDELASLVKRLEAGGLTLEQSLELWERGEELADICEDWLEGARARLAAAVARRDDRGERSDRGGRSQDGSASSAETPF